MSEGLVNMVITKRVYFNTEINNEVSVLFDTCWFDSLNLWRLWLTLWLQQRWILNQASYVSSWVVLLGISQRASVPRRHWWLRGAVSFVFTALFTISVLSLQRRSASDRKTEVSRKECNTHKITLSFQNNSINYLLHKCTHRFIFLWPF